MNILLLKHDRMWVLRNKSWISELLREEDLTDLFTIEEINELRTLLGLSTIAFNGSNLSQEKSLKGNEGDTLKWN